MWPLPLGPRDWYFYPRPPRGGRPIETFPSATRVRFLSTPSARRATSLLADLVGVGEISIHALREEGDREQLQGPHNGALISIHALREEGDFPREGSFAATKRFLSTPSARRATPGRLHRLPELGISIHALREEGDSPSRRSSAARGHFYPRPPRGGRPLRRFRTSFPVEISIHALREEGDPRRSTHLLRRRYFYPRPPRGGRLARAIEKYMGIAISIHALREEGDSMSIIHPKGYNYFYPRPPRGGRRFCKYTRSNVVTISIHALREEGDGGCLWALSLPNRFLSTPSARRATPCNLFRRWTMFNFYPRPPRGGRPGME